VADVVVVFDNVPPPLTLHETPALFLSLVTVAVRVTASVPSTVAAEAVTATLTGLEELPPQPVNQIDALAERQTARETRASFFRDIVRPR
jgi:hypothetical protein